jgi:hypothetical protein
MSIDGNNSAKRYDKAAQVDPRTFKSDYFLTREEVDRFQYEVRGSRKKADDEEDAVLEVRGPSAPPSRSPISPVV